MTDHSDISDKLRAPEKGGQHGTVSTKLLFTARAYALLTLVDNSDRSHRNVVIEFPGVIEFLGNRFRGAGRGPT
ncbi:hypothetical protein [Streptomyces sp. NPDC007264]|uniref:hypothetical protein n=1 Tax=Streptomyces sp. NPDC007264 TaxID=3364777 RepID=UPI0036DCCAAF